MFGLGRVSSDLDLIAGGKVRRTSFTNMETLSKILYARVISGCHFAIGAVALDQGLFSKQLNFFFNYDFPLPMAVDYVQLRFTPAHLEKMFRGEGILEYDHRYHLHRVRDTDFGLPLNTLVAMIQGPRVRHRMLVLFGTGRDEEKLAPQLDAIHEALEKSLQEEYDIIEEKVDRNEINTLLKRLVAIHPKQLVDHDLHELSALINQLDDYKESIPIPLRPRYTMVSQHVMKQRFGKKQLSA